MSLYSSCRQVEVALTFEIASEPAKTPSHSQLKEPMLHLMHSSIHWRLRCIDDSSSEENTPPNVLQTAAEQGCPSSAEVASSSTGTATPPWLPRRRPSAAPSPPRTRRRVQPRRRRLVRCAPKRSRLATPVKGDKNAVKLPPRMRASARRLSTCISPLLLAENTALVTSLSPTETIALVTLLPPTKDSAFVTPNKAVKFVTVPPLTKATKLVAPRWSQRLECFDRHVQHCWHLDQATCSCRRGGLTRHALA
ncbi:hypothetical protein PF001_g11593 [Phytophthora fragariae]|uniref:Uncharacterized protein n=2 Tax=Phytophthora fragariae TaxID=53985 RepID=A0A6A4DFI8_9STRA|nr:hypothetical protein PF001_g11593 [Phytophthora fragariae]